MTRSREESGPDQLTGSFEMVKWPEGKPIIHHVPPQPPTSFPGNIIYHVQTTLGRRKPRPPLSGTDQIVKEIANNAKSIVANHYKTRFTKFNVLNYEKTDYGGSGTLYTIEIQIAPTIKGHSLLKMQVVRSVTGADYLKDYWPV